jgi:hypothetical protein
MKFMASPRFLTMYSGVLTAIFATTILGGFASPAKMLSKRHYASKSFLRHCRKPNGRNLRPHNAVPAGHRPSLEELLLSPVRSCRSLRPSTYRLQ